MQMTCHFAIQAGLFETTLDQTDPGTVWNMKVNEAASCLTVMPSVFFSPLDRKTHLVADFLSSPCWLQLLLFIGLPLKIKYATYLVQFYFMINVEPQTYSLLNFETSSCI